MWTSNSNDKEDDNNKLDFPSLGDLDSAKREIGKFSNWFDQTMGSLRGNWDEANFEALGQTLGQSVNQFRSGISSDALAYPVPSIQQYSNCLDKGGRSIWTEDGFWRCILKGTNSVPDHLKKQFPDYTAFLDYQRKLVKERENAESRALENTKNDRPWSFSSLTSFPGSDRPRLITEEEARGKRLVSQSQETQTVTLDNGDLETRTKTIQKFDDGTAFVKSSKDVGSGSNNGWFWK